MNITNKDFFKTRFGKKLARKYFGHRYDEENPKKPTSLEKKVIAPVKKEPVVKQDIPQLQPVQQSPVQETIEEITELPTSEVPDFKKIFGDTDPDTKELFELEEQIQTAERHLSTTHTLDLYDFKRYCSLKGIVGEEDLCAGMVSALIGGGSVVLLGYSGSGKTFIADNVLDLFDDVYTMQQSSNMAVFNDADKINDSKIIYLSELQKAMKNKKAPIIEVIKDLTEGKDSNRIVTSKKGNGVVNYSIAKGKRIVATLADENDFKMDKESARRLTQFKTDSSEEHIQEIHNQKAKGRYMVGNNKKAITKLEKKLRQHTRECMDLDVEIIDPFAPYIVESIVPKTQKSVGYIDHYYNLVNGCTKFHFNQRVKINDLEGETYLMVNLEDHYNVFKMYFNEFIRTLKELAQEDKDDEALKQLENVQEPDWRKCFEGANKIIMESPELEDLRQEYAPELEEWYNCQVNSDCIQTRDYKTGKYDLIADLSLDPEEKEKLGGPDNEAAD